MLKFPIRLFKRSSTPRANSQEDNKSELLSSFEQFPKICRTDETKARSDSAEPGSYNRRCHSLIQEASPRLTKYGKLLGSVDEGEIKGTKNEIKEVNGRGKSEISLGSRKFDIKISERYEVNQMPLPYTVPSEKITETPLLASSHSRLLFPRNKKLCGNEVKRELDQAPEPLEHSKQDPLISVSPTVLITRADSREMDYVDPFLHKELFPKNPTHPSEKNRDSTEEGKDEFNLRKEEEVEAHISTKVEPAEDKRGWQARHTFCKLKTPLLSASRTRAFSTPLPSSIFDQMSHGRMLIEDLVICQDAR
ncbi:unnamed protein product, partial [Protopolystoma xenopodis]